MRSASPFFNRKKEERKTNLALIVIRIKFKLLLNIVPLKIFKIFVYKKLYVKIIIILLLLYIIPII